jgi:hypothetical protein
VLRPGDQIDQGLEVNRIPNFTTSSTPALGTRPTTLLQGRDCLAQGINFGLMIRW